MTNPDRKTSRWWCLWLWRLARSRRDAPSSFAARGKAVRVSVRAIVGLVCERVVCVRREERSPSARGQRAREGVVEEVGTGAGVERCVQKVQIGLRVVLESLELVRVQAERAIA